MPDTLPSDRMADHLGEHTRATPQRYVTGVLWAMVNAGASVVLPLAVFVVFARTVAPIEIGIVAMAVACTEVLKTLGLQGLYETLLQQREDRQRCHETALFVFLVSGVALFAVYLAALAALSRFMPGVAADEGALAFVGLRIVFDLATMQPQAELAHRLSYRMLALRAVIANALAGAAGITAAVLADGMTGLVLYQAGQSAIIFVASVVNNGALARPRFHAACFRRMSREAGLSTCVRLVAAAVNNVDQILVGALVGGLSLAYFNLGKRVESTFITAVNSLTSILFQPMFARQDRGGYDEILRRSAAVSTLICGIPAALVFAGSLPIIAVVFGPQWVDAAPVTAVFALSGFVRASGFVPGALMSVSGRNRDLLISSAASAAAGIALVYMMAPLGIVWCAAALAAKNALVLGWMTWWLHGQVSDPLRIYWRALVAPFALILGGIELGRWVAGVGDPGEDSVMRLTRLAAWLLPGVIAAGAYFAVFFGAQIRGVLRQR